MFRALLLVLAAASLLGTATPFITVPGNDPWISKPRYGVFPWEFTSDYAFALTVSPLIKAPLNPDGWNGYPQLPGFLSGPGVIVVLRYTDSPIGKYDELIYSAGAYTPHLCFLKQFQSVHRIWVSSEYSQRAGRNIWGYPKRLATFDWKEDSKGAVSVAVTDSLSGKVFFNATMSKLPLVDINFNSFTVSMASNILPKCVPSLQWPIDDNTNSATNSIYAQIPAYTTAQAVVAAARNASAAALAAGATATAAASKFASAMQPLMTNICFDMDGGSFVESKNVKLDAETLTGRASDKLSVVPLGLRLKTGAVATLSKPELLKCW